MRLVVLSSKLEFLTNVVLSEAFARARVPMLRIPHLVHSKSRILSCWIYLLGLDYRNRIDV